MYRKIFWIYIKTHIMRDMAYKWNFFVNIITDLVYSMLKVVFIQIIFDNISKINGIDSNYYCMLLGSSFLLDGFYMMFIFFNHTSLPSKIKDGTYDFVLIKPVSELFVTSIQSFNLAGIGNCILGIVLLNRIAYIYFCDWFTILIYIIMLCCGFVIYYSISLILFSMAFWIENADFLLLSVVDIAELTKFPHQFFPLGIRIIFTVIPIFSIISYPVFAIISNKVVSMLVIFSAIFIYLLAVYIFKKGCKVYSNR